jgi:tRNA pseudouridine32 synthase / 23S rRNA pseudouridine746 synthase
MARYRPNAPPARNGISPGCVVLPAGPWPSVAAFLFERFPGVPNSTWLQRLDAGDVVDDQGNNLTRHSAHTPGQRLYYYRAVVDEAPIPFEASVIYQDPHLLVADKPHFLPVLPSGNYLQETLLTRLKNKFDLPNLTPIHRIDRDTAGLVLFSIQPATRDAYHALFRNHQVTKTYEAIAPWNPNLPWPLTRQTRMIPSPQLFMQQIEVDGPPNTITHIKPLEVMGETGDLARYELNPVTGHRHQLRVHMAGLGLAILNDGIYPVLTPEGSVDYARPLQLLAKRIGFVDPLDGSQRLFESQRSLLGLQGE